MNGKLTPYDEFFPAQLAMMRLPDKTVDMDICHYMGGYGSGKSFIATVICLIKAAQNPGLNILIGAYSYEPTITEAVLPCWQERLDEWGLKEGKDYIWYGSKPKTLYLNCFKNNLGKATKVVFKSLKDAVNLRSAQYGLIHVEEANLIDHNNYMQLLGRLRQPNVKPPYRMLLTSNPTLRKDWLYTEFVELAGKRKNEAEGQEVVCINRRRVTASSYENRHLSKAYIAALRDSLTEEAYRGLIMGEDVMMTNALVVPNWSKANEDVGVVYLPDEVIYLACDFNVDPICWVLAHRLVNEEGLVEYHFFDEICYGPTRTEDASVVFADRYSEHKAGVVIVGDVSGHHRNTKSDMTDYEIMNAVIGSRLPDVSVNVPRSAYRVNGSIQLFVGMVKNHEGRIRIKLNPKKCKWLKWNMYNLQYVVGGDGHEIKEPQKHEIQQDLTQTIKFTKHPFDAARYLISRYEKFDPIRPKNKTRVQFHKPC